jgi:hypothetical protein
MRAYASGKRAYGARDAKTWFIRGPESNLLPLKHILSLASGIATRDFNTSDAIATAQSLEFEPIFVGNTLLADIAKVQQKGRADSTEVEQLILARLGQGSFRRALLKEHPRCFVTGYADPRMLVASHIKPWARSSDQERLDPKNGLLLIPTLDRAFDSGLISFNENGKIMVSTLLSNPEKLGIHRRLKLPDLAGREVPLEYHRRKVFKRAG